MQPDITQQRPDCQTRAEPDRTSASTAPNSATTSTENTAFPAIIPTISTDTPVIMPRASSTSLPPRPPARSTRSSARLRTHYAPEDLHVSHGTPPAPSQTQTPPPPSSAGRAVTRQTGNAPAQSTGEASNAGDERSDHVLLNSAALHRALQGKTLPISNSIQRLSHQLKYIEGINSPFLKDHVADLRKLFLDTLSLQLKPPNSARFHVFVETEDPATRTDTFSRLDLHTLFSPTVSLDRDSQKDTMCLLGELLVDFALINKRPDPCPAVARPVPTSTQTPSSMPLSTSIPMAASHQPSTAPSHPLPPPTGTINPQSAPLHSTAPTTPRRKKKQTQTGTTSKYIAPPHLVQNMALPSWFPAATRRSTEYFKNSTLRVEVDKFSFLSYLQAYYVYSALFRTAHAKALIRKRNEKLPAYRALKKQFNFITFTPPGLQLHWIVQSTENLYSRHC